MYIKAVHFKELLFIHHTSDYIFFCFSNFNAGFLKRGYIFFIMCDFYLQRWVEINFLFLISNLIYGQKTIRFKYILWNVLRIAFQLIKLPSFINILGMLQDTVYFAFVNVHLLHRAAASRAQEGQEELLHVQGQEGRLWGDTPHPR